MSPSFCCCCLVLSPSCASLISPIRLTTVTKHRFWGFYSDTSLPFVALLFVEPWWLSRRARWDVFFMRCLAFIVRPDLQENVAADQEESKEPKSTSTPPSTPVRAEEGELSPHPRHTQHAWPLTWLWVYGASGWDWCVWDVECPGCPLACLFWDLFMWWCLILLLVFCNNRPRSLEEIKSVFITR